MPLSEIPDLAPYGAGGLGTLVLVCCGWLLNRYRKALLGGEALADERVAKAMAEAESRVKATVEDSNRRVGDLRGDFEEWRAISEAELLRTRGLLAECEARCKVSDQTVANQGATIAILGSEMANMKAELAQLRNVS